MSHPYFTHRFDSTKAPEKIWASWLLPAFWQATWQDLSSHFSISEPIHLGSAGLITFTDHASYQLQIIELHDQERLTVQFRSHSARFNLHYALESAAEAKTKVKVSLTVEQPIDSSSLVSTLINPIITRHITVFQSLLEKTEQPTQTQPAEAPPAPEPETATSVDVLTPSPDKDATAAPSNLTLPSLGFSLWQIANRWQSHVRAALKPHGLTPTQWLLLFTLVRMEKDELVVTPTLLAQALNLNTMLVSDVIKLLVNKHLVHKIKIMPDRRSFKISATAAGKITAVEAHTDVILAEKRFFRDLAQDERPVAKYLDLMKQQIASQDEKKTDQTSISTTSGK
jgi:DNA-binding MarR family transcriptional regulator